MKRTPTKVFIDMVSAKERLRTQVLKIRANLGVQERARASEQACAHFLRRVALEPGAMVALYWPIGAELDCRGLIGELVKGEQLICLPVVKGRDLPLIFRAWDGKSGLEAASFGTKVPGPEAGEAVPDLMVMPLAGFDKRGNRLGYGKGYYDRTIAGLAKKPHLIGLAFSAQQVAHIPASCHDVPLDMIVTEKGVVDFGQGPLKQESELR